MSNHGTYTRYTRGCRCTPCTQASKAYNRARRRAIALGQWRGMVDATGTQRRLRALVALGWPMEWLSRRMGAHPDTVGNLFRSGLAKPATADRVRQLYDELWDTPPATSTAQEAGEVAKARRRAQARGWPPPMAWDDDEIDDPTATAVVPLLMPAVPRLPGGDELLWLIEQGETIPSLARRYGVLEISVERAVYRAREESRVSA